MNLKTLEDAAFIWNTGWAITCSREYESMTCENIHEYKYMSNRNAGQATTFWRVQRSRALRRSPRRVRRTWRRRRRRGRSARKMARDPRFCILTWEFFGLISCWIKVTLTFYGYIFLVFLFLEWKNSSPKNCFHKRAADGTRERVPH